MLCMVFCCEPEIYGKSRKKKSRITWESLSGFKERGYHKQIARSVMLAHFGSSALIDMFNNI